MRGRDRQGGKEWKKLRLKNSLSLGRKRGKPLSVQHTDSKQRKEMKEM
jgi:hypothetical protein